MARFVLGPLLRFAAPASSKRLGPKAGRGWSHIAQSTKLKAFGIKVLVIYVGIMVMTSASQNDLTHAHVLMSAQALARALVPDGPSQQSIPTGVLEVTTTVVSQLLQLLDVGAAVQPDMATDAAAIRLAAAAALLRLARIHDSLMDAKAFRTLALVIQACLLLSLPYGAACHHNNMVQYLTRCSYTVQDPVVEVRREFARKLSRLVKALQVLTGCTQMACSRHFRICCTCSCRRCVLRLSFVK